ncbi:protein TolR [Methylomagnum sp.]
MNVSTGRGRGQRRRPMAEINVVPYIDVSLVLLIIFMVTAPMLQTGVDVELQATEGKAFDPSQDLPIIISVKADGRLFVDAGNQSDAEVGEAELPGKVTDALAKKPGLAVLIRGDKNVDYGRVLVVFGALKKAGVDGVSLMTAPIEE